MCRTPAILPSFTVITTPTSVIRYCCNATLQQYQAWSRSHNRRRIKFIFLTPIPPCLNFDRPLSVCPGLRPSCFQSPSEQPAPVSTANRPGSPFSLPSRVTSPGYARRRPTTGHLWYSIHRAPSAHDPGERYCTRFALRSYRTQDSYSSYYLIYSLFTQKECKKLHSVAPILNYFNALCVRFCVRFCVRVRHPAFEFRSKGSPALTSQLQTNAGYLKPNAKPNAKYPNSNAGFTSKDRKKRSRK